MADSIALTCGTASGKRDVGRQECYCDAAQSGEWKFAG